jgi:hypothetical protein
VRAHGRAYLARAVLLRGIRTEQSVEDADTALELTSAAGDDEARCMALDIVAAHASYFGDSDRARVVAREERALAERLGDPYHLAMAIMRQAWAEPRLREARAFADEAIPRLRRCGNLSGVAEVTAGMVGAALLERDYETAAEAGEEGLRAAEEAGQPFSLAIALGNAALPALFVARMDLAEQLFREQLELRWRERIELLWDEPALGLACVAAHAGDHERAAILIGAFEALPAIPCAPCDREVQDRLIAMFIAPARAAFGERAWRRAAATGAAMSPDELCEFALAERTHVASGEKERRVPFEA